MRDIKYWKKEIATMHPTEYINLLQAIQDHHSMLIISKRIVVNK